MDTLTKYSLGEVSILLGMRASVCGHVNAVGSKRAGVEAHVETRVQSCGSSIYVMLGSRVPHAMVNSVAAARDAAMGRRRGAGHVNYIRRPIAPVLPLLPGHIVAVVRGTPILAASRATPPPPPPNW